MDLHRKYLLSTREFSEYAGVSLATLKRRIRGGMVSVVKAQARSGYRRNHSENLIHYSQLESPAAREQFLKDRGLTENFDGVRQEEGDYDNFKPWQRTEADRRLALIQKWLSLSNQCPRKRRTLFKKDFCKENSVSRQSLDRWLLTYKEGGFPALVPEWSPGKQKRILSNEMKAFIEKSFLVPFGPPLLKTYEDLIKQFSPLGVPLPTYRTVAAWVSSKWSKSEQLLIRDKEQWERKFGLYIQRDWTQVKTNELWFSDAKQIDVACLFRGKPVFPWFTAFLDAHSRKFVGYVLTPGHDSLTIGQAFKNAVERHGLPREVYTDLGKPYKSRLIAGDKIQDKVIPLFDDFSKSKLPGIFRELGVNLFFSGPYRGQEKIIEPAFKIFTYRFRHLPGYRAHNTKLRPKKLARELKNGDLLTFEQLSAEVGKLIDARNARKHSTTGKIPNDFYKNFVPQIPSKDVLAFLLMDVHVKKVKNSGVVIGGLFYRGQDLWKISGEEVEIRRDPQDIRQAAIIFKGKLFGFASLETPSHYRDAVTLESVKTARRIRRRISKFRKVVLENQAVVDDPLNFAVELEGLEGVRGRDIRPALSSKVVQLHQKQKLAKDVATGLEKAQKTGAGGPVQEAPEEENPFWKAWGKQAALLENSNDEREKKISFVRDEDLRKYFED